MASEATVPGAQPPEQLEQPEQSDQKAKIVGVFGRAAATYDQVGPNFFGPWAEKLLDLVALQPGAHALDVATGRGAVLRRAAERVGPQGHVTGVDLAAPMIEALSADVRRQGIGNATVRVMDAEQLDFPDATFDALLCGFGLMFFPHPVAALAGFRRVLRPRGLLGLSYLTETALRDERWAWRMEIAEELGLKTSRAPTALEDVDDLRAAVSAAGFQDIHVEDDRTELRFADADDYWAWTWSHGMRAQYEMMDATTLERYKRRAYEHLKAQHARGELAQSVRALFLTARRPA